MDKRLLFLILLAITIAFLGGGWWYMREQDPAPSVPESVSTPMPDSMESEHEAIEIIIYDENYIPISQLRVGESHPPHPNGPGCPEQHWHADASVESINGVVFTDPLPGGCGFGTLTERPIFNYDPNLGQE